ncbi:C40 family peptidase [Cohnella fermenti]|uniref:NlpC/P60 family protein n=1 Tax=Cohnella fermenti TaxID=2565925 RepID=A0A4V3WDN7_9BACL|nr:SH3 domain-containing C40 family peptidase [Cohnella fermenti]THF72832.1 NlpC/P60 family protein [Cohnella fermenti]
MRRSLMIAVAASMLATAIPGAAGAAVKEGSAQIVSSVSFRTAPSTSSDVMRYLKKGETVAVLEETNAYWLKVRDSSGTVGYVSSREQYVNLTAAPTETADAAVGAANATIVASVNFRNAPSTSGDRIRYLAKGEQVTVTSQVNSYWYAVTDASGVSGYVSTSSSYIKLTGAIAGSGSANSGSGSSNSGTGSSNSDSGTGVSASAKIEAVIAAGMAYLGTPYEYGSDRSTTTTFDCSDFVRQAFKDALGVTLPADSSSQGAYVRGLSSVTTDWKQLKRGDLMFFMDYKGTSASLYTNKSAFGSSISHVAIYLGNGQVLHTYSKESGGVRVDSIEGRHWEYRFLYGGSAI